MCTFQNTFFVSMYTSTIADVDECNVTNTCDQICINKPGSYYCECKDGHRKVNKTHCQGITNIYHLHVNICMTIKYIW